MSENGKTLSWDAVTEEYEERVEPFTIEFEKGIDSTILS